MSSSAGHLRPHLWLLGASCLQHLPQINIERVKLCGEEHSLEFFSRFSLVILIFLHLKNTEKSILLQTGGQVS